MDNSIKTFFSFLISKDEKLGTKLIFTILIIVLILILNNVFGFSYYYNSDKKINQVKEISLILENENVSFDTKKDLEKMRNEILSRENIFQYISSIKLDENEDPSKIDYVNSNTHLIFNYLSSSWYFILIILVTIFKIIKERDFDFVGLIIYLLLGLVLFGAGLALSFFTNFIPILYSNMIWLNYVLNFVIVLILFFPVIKLDYQNQISKNRI